MKTNLIKSILLSAVILFVAACNTGTEQPAAATSSSASEPVGGGQSNVSDEDSKKDVVKIAVGSKDHTTLVTALQTAEYVDVLANAGPFTVFAPTNDAFAKLPAGTVESLLKPENKDKLREILEYHVFVGGLKPEQLTDGRILNMVSLHNATIKNDGNGKSGINTANVLGAVEASNGMVYVIDEVLLPPSK
jgi:uncharacterized surface protein with fasciclin (FAS1) repeats